MSAAADPEHRHFGRWCLAANLSVQVTGILEEKGPGNYRLELAGVLSPPACQADDNPIGRHRILGWLENGRLMTLEGCEAIRTNTWGEIQRQSWFAESSVRDVHINAADPWTFVGASFVMPGLTQWVCRATTGFEIQKDEKGKPSGLGLLVSIESWKLWTHRDATVELVRTVSTKQVGEVITQLESRVDVRAHAPRRMTDDDFQQLAIRPLQTLVALATGEFTTAISGAVALAPHSHDGNNRYFEFRWRPLEITVDPNRTRHGFFYSDFVALGDDALQSWVNRSIAIRPVVDLYLGVLQKDGFAELKFLMVVQALEVYHRTTTTASILGRELWKPVEEKLREVIQQAQIGNEPEVRREQLLRRLSHFNDVTLSQRLKTLLDLVPDHKGEVCGGRRGGFIRKVVDARNYFTHWSTNEESTPVERGPELFHLTCRLIALLELILLREIGFLGQSSAAAEVMRRRISWLPASADVTPA